MFVEIVFVEAVFVDTVFVETVFVEIVRSETCVRLSMGKLIDAFSCAAPMELVDDAAMWRPSGIRNVLVWAPIRS